VTNDDLYEAEQSELLGDGAGAVQAATAHYRAAQRWLLPAGAVFTDRGAYDQRMEAFERIQQKIYALEVPAAVAPVAAETPVPEAAPASPLQAAAAQLTVWDFAPGLVIRVCQSFRDYDGQEIHAGEVLHFLGSSYFPYDSGHTLQFAEKVIRLAGVVEEHEAILANAGNAWFEPLT
jgi:hypothetical protein